MIDLPAERIAAEAGAEIVVRGGERRPERAVVDSRSIEHGDLFVGLPGLNDNGGRFAADALRAGAWGVLVDPVFAVELASDAEAGGAASAGWVLSAADPLAGLQSLARAWRRQLGCPLVGITGSTGKTSVKDIARAILPRRVHASPENFNTEIGMPLALLGAPPETELLVMEMAMRGLGQIEELCAIAEPDVAAITNIGPVHLELLGTIEAIAEAKAEILAGLGTDGRAVVPASAEALEPHLHDQLITFTFGPGGDVFVVDSETDGRTTRARVGTPHGEAAFEFPFAEPHNLLNALCAIAIGVALELPPEEMAARTSQIEFSRLRGEQVGLQGGILLLNDCYNANPLSMRAAIDHLSGRSDGRRRLAVLGGMAELGPGGPDFHREVAALARERGVGPLIGVGDLARDYSPDHWVADAEQAIPLLESLLEPGDVALIKGSRSVGLERIADGLVVRIGAGR